MGFQVFLYNTNNFHIIIGCNVFLSNPNNFHKIMGFQVFLYYINNTNNFHIIMGFQVFQEKTRQQLHNLQLNGIKYSCQKLIIFK